MRKKFLPRVLWSVAFSLPSAGQNLVFGSSDLSTDLLLWGIYNKNAFRRFEGVGGPEKMRKARKCIYKISSLRVPITPKACMESRLSLVWNPQLVAVWNHHEVMYGINPKGDTRWSVMPYACGDSIHDCVVITYQSFGLDRKKHACACFFLPLAMMGAALNRCLPGRNAMLVTSPM